MCAIKGLYTSYKFQLQSVTESQTKADQTVVLTQTRLELVVVDFVIRGFTLAYVSC